MSYKLNSQLQAEVPQESDLVALVLQNLDLVLSLWQDVSVPLSCADAQLLIELAWCKLEGSRLFQGKETLEDLGVDEHTLNCELLQLRGSLLEEHLAKISRGCRLLLVLLLLVFLGLLFLCLCLSLTFLLLLIYYLYCRLWVFFSYLCLCLLSLCCCDCDRAVFKFSEERERR